MALVLLGIAAVRFVRVAMDNQGAIIGLAIVGAIAVGILVIVAVCVARFRVTALSTELVTTALIRTRHIPSEQIGRVLLRTISFSGSPRKELIVVDKDGGILTRVLAAFFHEEELRMPFAALGFVPEGSWSDIVTLGAMEGFSNDALASKLLRPNP